MTLPYRRALITGGTGFIGPYLIRALLLHAVEIHFLTRRGELPETLRDITQKITAHRGDLLNRKGTRDLIRDVSPEAVFHLAAYGTLPSERDFAHMIAVNITGTTHLLEAVSVSSCRTFVQAGSVKEYGDHRVPITENTPSSPADMYGVSKACATLVGQYFARRHRVPVTVLRCGPVYGPRDLGNRFLPSAIRASLTGAPFSVAAGKTLRSFLYIDDLIAAYLRASATPDAAGEIVNIGSPEQVTYDEVLTRIERLTGKPITRSVWNEIGATPARTLPHGWPLDLTKAKVLLGWEPAVSFDEGLRHTIEWIRQTMQTTHAASARFHP